MPSVLQNLEALLGFGLLAHAALQITQNPTWWAYVPVYAVPALLAVFQKPRNATWRAASSLAIVAGGLYTAFLLWTYTAIDSTPTLTLAEGKNLAPISFGALLISFIRITQDKISQPVHYIRTTIILAVAVISLYALITSLQYF
uniref:GPI ethanolamine phosphate transferase 1 n=1 Tax=Caenorhabditis japonica TaxID=281687 RepID=A0A8R1DRM5_CAEJA